MLDRVSPGDPAFASFPKEHWRQLWPNDEWAVVRRLMSAESTAKALTPPPPTELEEAIAIEAAA